MSTPTPLEEDLRRIIAIDGPIPVARYMALCLGHPAYGYYTTRDPLGAAGDFITAPEVSQMFGEMLGLWAAAVWQGMGSPVRILLVELGPGRGTLMADALWTARAVPAFGRALSIHLVETSPVLREQQQKKLARAGVPITWHDDIADVPDGPLLVLANEFFDALPVHQVVKAAKGWHERMVGIAPDGQLAFALHPEPIPNYEMALPEKLRGAPLGSVYEWRSDAIMQEASRRIAAFGGAALVADYGHAQSGVGDTLQAVREHGFVDPLRTPGEADLTAHVDFEALAQAATRAGARAYGAIPQGDFLRRIGIEGRAAKLKKVASEKQAADVDSALVRLTGSGPNDMGALFQVLALADPKLGVPPGFDT